VRRVAKISSRQHPSVQACRRLARGPSGDGSILLDGEHLVIEALGARVPIHTLLTRDVDEPLARRAAAAGATVYQASADAIDAASPVRTSSGVVAIAQWAPSPLDAVFSASPALVLGIIDVQDPGNLGAIIRSADALGATAVITTPAGADPGGWKALRGAMGSTFHLPIARVTLADAIRAARARGLRVAAATAGPGQPIDRAALVEPLLLLLGNEGAGLPAAVVSAADVSLTIPMRTGANSLNVAVAAALLLYEATRQRHARRAGA
jgi:TrmH family RNA methyltransferase